MEQVLHPSHVRTDRVNGAQTPPLAIVPLWQDRTSSPRLPLTRAQPLCT